LNEWKDRYPRPSLHLIAPSGYQPLIPRIPRYRSRPPALHPIDEGVLSFQNLYDEAIVSPAYDTWNIRDEELVDSRYLAFPAFPICSSFLCFEASRDNSEAPNASRRHFLIAASPASFLG
jgi:hypothetical protein